MYVLCLSKCNYVIDEILDFFFSYFFNPTLVSWSIHEAVNCEWLLITAWYSITCVNYSLPDIRSFLQITAIATRQETTPGITYYRPQHFKDLFSGRDF